MDRQVLAEKKKAKLENKGYHLHETVFGSDTVMYVYAR